MKGKSKLVEIRARRRRLARSAVTTLNVFCALAVALPAQLLTGALPAAAIERGASLPDFAAESAALGLMAVDTVLVEPAGTAANGHRVSLVTTAASAPPGYAPSSLFFRRLSSFQIESASGEPTPILESEVLVGEANGHITIDAIDRLALSFDAAAAQASALAGLEIRRRVELDMDGFDAMIAAVSGAGAPGHAERPALLARMLGEGEIELRNFRHSVTVRYPNGRERAFAGDEFDFAGLLQELGVDAQTNGTTIYDCYDDIGVDLTIFGAACLVAGVVVCGVACAVTAGIACIPCISGASLACGLGAAVGSLGYCLAKILFGVDPPPTATRVPTSTRTPTATATPALPGDCDGDARVTVGELVTGVAIALGRGQLSQCRSFDRDGDGRLSVGELIAAVRTALGR